MPKGEKTKLLWSDPVYRDKMSDLHKGKKQSSETIEKRVSQFRNENSWNWKGDNVSYSGNHKWIARKKGKPSFCAHCKTITAKRFEWANISREYKRDVDDWISLCKKCHWAYDDVSNKIWIKRRLNISYV